MPEFERLERDLRFVRGAIEASDQRRSPSAIYFLWALVILTGFVLVDVRARAVPVYWAVAAPASFAASVYLGWRHARRSGQASAREGRRHVLHWGGMLAALALAALLPMRGVLRWEDVGSVILLLLAFGYFTAGVHTDRWWAWVGGLMAAGYVAVTLFSAYAWTIVGVALAAALTMAGMRGGPAREATR